VFTFRDENQENLKNWYVVVWSFLGYVHFKLDLICEKVQECLHPAHYVVLDGAKDYSRL